MSVVDDIRGLTTATQRLTEMAEEHGKAIERHEEQITGQGGLVNAVREVAKEVRELRSTLNRLLFAVVTASLGLAAAVVVLLVQ